MKLVAFISCVGFCFGFNGFFYGEKLLHKIYEDKGTYKFLKHLPYMIYSTIVAGLLSYLIRLLTLSENEIYKMKQNKDQIALFNKIISKRNLQEANPVNTVNTPQDGDEIIITNAVCSHASDELKEYYKTNDLSKIDLDNGAIKCEDKDKDYMKALIGIVQKLVEGDKNDENENNESISGGGRRNLRNLLDKDTEENIKTYGHRVLALIVFLAFSIF